MNNKGVKRVVNNIIKELVDQNSVLVVAGDFNKQVSRCLSMAGLFITLTGRTHSKGRRIDFAGCNAGQPRTLLCG